MGLNKKYMETPQIQSNQKVFNPYARFISKFFLVCLVGTAYLYILDKQYMGNVILNPLMFFVLGLIVARTKTVYIPSSRFTYYAVEGGPAQFVGAFLVLVGIASWICFNTDYFNSSEIASKVWIAQFVGSLIVLMIVSIKYGVRLRGNTPTIFRPYK